MDKPRKVVLYGNSLVLGGMKASLQSYPNLQIITLDISPETGLRDLCALDASVVIFDLATVPSEFPLSLLHEQPELVLIGMDAAGEKLLILSGQQARTLTTSQLVQMIDSLPQASPSQYLPKTVRDQPELQMNGGKAA
jgi:hypothetical protein